jgi:circadian clock protein KaiC
VGDKMAAQDLIRLRSGIPGMDEMMEGGFPFPSTVLVAGGAGTGKTTMALQFLAKGAQEGEQGLFFTTLSEPTQWMLRFVSRYGFIDRSYFGKQIKYIDLGPFLTENNQPARILEYIEEQIAEHMPQRIVIDPLTVVGEMISGSYRTFLYDLATRLKNWQAVSVLTGEVLPGQMYPVELSYVVDTLVLLSTDLSPEGTRRKYLEILKMRGTNHATGKNLVDLSARGFVVQVGLR